MIVVEPFRAAHAHEIVPQPAQAEQLRRTVHLAEHYERAGNGYAMRCDGRLVVCAGLIETEVAPLHLWAIVAERAPMVAVHRVARRFLSVFRGEITATVDAAFADGCRWMGMLGFSRRGVRGNELIYVRSAL